MFDINQIVLFLMRLALLIPAVCVHEFAHALAADRLGDKTARNAGRLTLNPLAHIDPMWTVLLPLMLFISTRGMFVFGSAKPVPINYRFLGNPRKDVIWIGLAGPVANFLLAFLCFVLLRFLRSGQSASLLVVLAQINIFLGVFNLIPVPPLDGSRIAAGLLPERLSTAYLRIEPYGIVIMIALLWFNVVDLWVLPLSETILRLFSRIL